MRITALQTGSLIKRVSDDVTLPEVIVGMDVLRKLHMYMAFKERRLYLTEAGSDPAASVSTCGRRKGCAVDAA